MNFRKFLGVLYRRITPLALQYFIDCKRAVKYWSKRKVIFIHVPKSAGVALSNALYGRSLGHIPFFAMRRFLGASTDEYYFFTYIRDPKSRFVSAVNYARDNWDEIKGSKGLPSKDVLFGDINNIAISWLEGKSDDELNYIFKTQSFYVENGDNFVNLFLFENIASSLDFLKKDTGLDIEIKKMNSSIRKREEISDRADNALRAVYERDYRLYAKVKNDRG